MCALCYCYYFAKPVGILINKKKDPIHAVERELILY